MSSRNYKSGAQKRKVALEKKRLQEDALKKVPKITQMFGNNPSTSASASSSVDQSENDSSTQSLEEIVEHVESINLSEDYGDDVQPANLEYDTDVETASSLSIPTTHRSNEYGPAFPNDVALWDLQTDLPLLQKYWAKHGKSTHVF